MKTNKYFFLITTALLSGLFCAYSAMAEVKEPEAYLRLTAIESFKPAQAPKFQGGHHELSTAAARYHESLPVQLSGASERITHTGYRPSRVRNINF